MTIIDVLLFLIALCLIGAGLAFALSPAWAAAVLGVILLFVLGKGHRPK